LSYQIKIYSMRQIQKHDDVRSVNTLNGDNGLPISTETIYNLSETCWVLTYTALWNTSIFSETETEKAREFIFHYLITSDNAYKAYINLSQRVLLARNYINNGMNRFIPLPSQWFDIKNEKGFLGTQKWYDQMQSIRSSLPVYKIELKALAEAVLEMNEDGSLNNYRYWKHYFIEKNCPDLLNLFMAIVANGKWEGK
jgi:hypothetical protein